MQDPATPRRLPAALFLYTDKHLGRLTALPEEANAVQRLFGHYSDKIIYTARYNFAADDFTAAFAGTGESVAIVHLAGHGSAEGIQREGDDGSIVPLGAATLRDYLAIAKNLQLVFLNACQSRGLVLELRRLGLPLCIGTIGDIDDAAAAKASAAFYEAILKGDTFEVAFGLLNARYNELDPQNPDVYQAFWRDDAAKDLRLVLAQAYEKSALDDFNDYLNASAINLQMTTSQPLVGKTVKNLDAKQVKKFLALPLVKKHLKSRKLIAQTPLAEKLRALTLMTNGYVLKGTFFCLADAANLTGFGANVSSCSFGAFSSLNKVHIRQNEQVTGNLIEQYEALYELICKALAPIEIVQWYPRIEDYAIPHDVFRELLANAFIHRNYADNTHFRVTVDVFPDRIVIENAGHFLENINPNDLNSIRSKHINPEISRVFFLNGWIEMQGTGIRRIQEILAERGLRPAEFRQENNIVTVTVYKRESIEKLRNELNDSVIMGGNDATENIVHRLLRVLEVSADPYSEDTAKTYNNIANVYHAQGNYVKALTFYQKVLSIQEKLFGAEHSDTAAIYNNIGMVYNEEGDYAQALVFYKKALSITEKLLGTEHTNTAKTYSNIGLVYNAQGYYEQALAFHQKAVSIQEKLFGIEHPNTATTYNNIAAVYHAQRDYAQALAFFEKALKIFKKALPFGHHTIKTVLHNYKNALNEGRATLPQAEVERCEAFLQEEFGG